MKKKNKRNFYQLIVLVKNCKKKTIFEMKIFPYLKKKKTELITII